MQRELAGVAADAGDAGRRARLRLTDVRALLGDHLAGRPTRANFRTGTLTVCTMVPMRSVPHRVVCLLGLDDGVFPRAGLVDGDDVLARPPVTGERDVRCEDRQLLLDAIGAATETLVVTYTGANEHTGQRRPPAVPLGELLDALDRTTEAPVRDGVVVEAPAPAVRRPQRRARRARHAGAVHFDPTDARGGAGRGRRARPPRPPFLAEPLPPVAGRTTTSALADLVAFFRDPVKGFFRAARPHPAVGRRRRLRRDAGRDRPRSRRGGSATGCSRDMLPASTPTTALPDRVAPRRAAAGPARLAHGDRDPRAAP